MSSTITKIFASLALILILVPTVVYFSFRTYYVSQVQFNGQVIKIDRDDYGIPKLHVNQIQQYLYAFGTVLAEDRLFQISFRCLVAQGRISQFIGEKGLEFDRFMREVNLKKWAERKSDKLKRENITYYQKVEAMADGINDRVAKMLFLPLQFQLIGFKWQNFTVNHLFYLQVLSEWSLSMNIADQYTRSIFLANFTHEEIDLLLPNKKQTWAFQSITIVSDEEIPDRVRTEDVKQQIEEVKFNPIKIYKYLELDILHFIEDIQGTNVWAVSGNHTKSGKPILCHDPHLESVIPSQWYQYKLNYTTSQGKNIRATGMSLPGVPQFIGKTNYFASGMSISHGDNQDLFRETIQDGKYLVNGVWKDLKKRVQTILIKTSEGLKEQTHEVYETHRGPIIQYIFGPLGSFKIDQGDHISVAWTGFNDEYRAFTDAASSHEIDNLQDLRQFTQSKSYFLINMLFITVDNHLLMQQAGVHPIRRNSDSGNYIKNGTTTQHDWVGLVPPQDRMHLEDPKKGYIIHANNRVASSEYYGGYLNHTIFTARADRIDEVIRNEINSGRKIDMDFAKRSLADTVDIYCRQILPQILKTVNKSRQTHSNFDCNFTSKSHLATMYEVFMYELYHLTKQFTPQKMSIISMHWTQQTIFNHIHDGFRGNKTKITILNQAWQKMLQHLSNHFKTDNKEQWIWGVFHVDTMSHILFRNHPILKHVFNLRFPGSGNFHTPNVAKMEKLQFNNFETTHRANYRAIFSFSEIQESQFVSDAGASQNIFSGHYSDQWSLFKQNKLISISQQQSTQDLDL